MIPACIVAIVIDFLSEFLNDDAVFFFDTVSLNQRYRIIVSHWTHDQKRAREAMVEIQYVGRMVKTAYPAPIK
jgi:hypothetical protein